MDDAKFEAMVQEIFSNALQDISGEGGVQITVIEKTRRKALLKIDFHNVRVISDCSVIAEVVNPSKNFLDEFTKKEMDSVIVEVILGKISGVRKLIYSGVKN